MTDPAGISGSSRAMDYHSRWTPERKSAEKFRATFWGSNWSGLYHRCVQLIILHIAWVTMRGFHLG
jgi:hypothetical protein